MGNQNLSAVRKNLPTLVARVNAGERIQITRHGKVVAELVPPRKKKKQKNPLKGSVLYIADDFDAPMDDLWDAVK